MREQYCIHIIEMIRSRPVIRMIKKHEMFVSFTPSFAGRVDCISKVMPELMKIWFPQSYHERIDIQCVAV